MASIATSMPALSLPPAPSPQSTPATTRAATPTPTPAHTNQSLRPSTPPAPTTASTQPSSPPPPTTDPYVIYQLRKPSQRGTAVIPRFVPNTHAPAFSPANYRFARVWAAQPSSPPSILHIPRSFEAASLGSESSFWSEASSWMSPSVSLSVSSLRTAGTANANQPNPSPRPLLAPGAGAVPAAAAFFSDDFPRPHSRTTLSLSPARSTVTYPPALSESVSEDAVIDDLLSATRPQYPRLSSEAHKTARRADPPRSRPKHDRERSLPVTTHKRRSLWTWLFCAEDGAAASVMSASVTANSHQSPNPHPRDRVQHTDKEYFRPHSKPRMRRGSSFEIRRGAPDGRNVPRSASWSSLVTRTILGRAPGKKKRKDRPRAVPDERHSNHISFQKPSLRSQKPAKPSRHIPDPPPRRTPREPPSHDILSRERRQDRPRETSPRATNDSTAPQAKSVVPSMRESNGAIPHMQARMRSGDSDQIASRISSDLSNSTQGRRSSSANSTPVLSVRRFPLKHELDPAAIGISSDVSSHASGNPKSPPTHIPSIIAEQDTHRPSELFPFASSSSSSGAFVDATDSKPWSHSGNGYPEYTSAIESQRHTALTLDPVARAREKNRARSAGGPLSYLMKHHESDPDANTVSSGLTSLADESVSTHKTISEIGDDYQFLAGSLGLSRNAFREAARNARLNERLETDISDSSGPPGPPRPIFKNSALFSHTARMSPSHGSASPRRFHSDWSDPHATDIDVYCQCSCSCVYEEECRRTCELVYGRSPSVSSSRSCTKRTYRGFQSLPPPSDNSGLKYGRPGVDTDSGLENDGGGYDPRPHGVGRFVDPSASAQKTYIRAHAVDELPDPHDSSETRDSTQYSQSSTVTDPRYANAGSSRMYEPRRHIPNIPTSSHKHTHRKPQYVEDPRKTQGRTYRSGSGQPSSRRGPHESSGSAPKPYRSAESSKRKSENSQRNVRNQYGSTSGQSGDEKSRVSSRRVGSGTPERSSGQSRQHDRARMSSRYEETDTIAAERRRREAEEQQRHKASVAARSGRVHTGSSGVSGSNFVVKRNGLPPSGHSVIPQPYRASDYHREANMEYNAEPHSSEGNGWLDESRMDPYEDLWEQSSSGFGPPPIVEAEFATGSMSSSVESRRPRGDQSSMEYGGYGDSTRQGSRERKSHRKGESGHASRSTEHTSKDSTWKGSSGQKRPTSRQTSKSSNRSSRTPILGIF